MAFDQISAITHNYIVPVLVEQVFKSNPFFVRMVKKAQRIPGGNKIQQPLLTTAPTSVFSYKGLDRFPITQTQEIDAAEFDWCQYGGIIAVDGLSDMKNSGPDAVVNLIKTKVQALETQLKQEMGADLYLDGTGNSSKDILGLAAAIDDGTNVSTYGGLSRSTNTSWQAVYADNSGVGREVTFKLIQTYFGRASIDNARPTLMLTTQDVYDKILSLTTPNQRFQNDELASIGFPNVLYQGRPIVVDQQIATAGNDTLWMVNEDFFTLYIHTERGFRFVPFQMAVEQDAIVAKILFGGQLVCRSPRMQVQLRDLDPSL